MTQFADKNAKRLVDLVGSASLLLLLGPMAITVALVIRASSPGPIFYCQDREGLHGRPFRIRKLRTMHADGAERLRRHLATNPDAATEYAGNRCLASDPRVVGRVGALARKYSIDEIPQFWNVLMGEMSLVGPRPLMPSDAQMLFDEQTRELRLEVLPGISGLWQVKRFSKSDIIRNVAELDLLYIRTRSVWLDLWILWRTPSAVLSGGGLT